MPLLIDSIRRLLDGLANTMPNAGGDWVPEEHENRLRQYAFFRALHENAYGELFKDPAKRKKLREYGDYSLVVDTSRDAVLGDQVGIDVPGADDEANAGAVARRLMLQQWAKRERWASRLYMGETDAAAVGDAVYEIRAEGDRITLRAHDPESFFPVWKNSVGDFDEAYLAWEERNTGQYLPTQPANLTDLRNRDGEDVLYVAHYRTVDRATAAALGVRFGGDDDRQEVALVSAAWYRIKKRDGTPARGFAFLEKLADEVRADGTPVKDSDTGFETPPLWYVPNLEQTGQPWGKPEGASVFQALIDAAQDHTDLKENTFYNAFPPLYDENPPAPQAVRRPGEPATPNQGTTPYKPGTIYNGRKLGAVDLSNGNALLLEHERFLIDKVLTNTRTTHIAAGLVKPNEVPSGAALLIGMMPLVSKTMPKRIIREDKLGLMLKHVIRWHRRHGNPADFDFSELNAAPGATVTLEDGEQPTGESAAGWPAGIFEREDARPLFGNIIPIDRKQVSEMVRDLLGAGAISDVTAVAMLMAAGFPIDDATEEVERLKEAAQPPVGAPGAAVDGGGRLIDIEEE